MNQRWNALNMYFRYTNKNYLFIQEQNGPIMHFNDRWSLHVLTECINRRIRHTVKKHISSLIYPFISQPEEGSIRYAHLDITAMETAQRVALEHVQGREDRLTQLESRRLRPPKWLGDTSKYFSLLSISLNKLKCSNAVDHHTSHCWLKYSRSCASVQKFPQSIHSTKSNKKKKTLMSGSSLMQLPSCLVLV